MEDIEKELEEKSIERNIEIKEIESGQEEEEEEKVPPTPKVKSKRVRSQKQIEAFEKARLKRAEAIALRKKEKEEDKIEKKELKKELKKEFKKIDSDDIIQEKPIPEPVYNPSPKSQISYAQREQVIQNHYYGLILKKATKEN